MINRLSSIDFLRALTMLIMIFVNDFWTLHDIPRWLEHTGADEDGLGLSDVVFPAFLFIVGLSIPFAIQARRNKGDTYRDMGVHIVIRSLALIAMGFFMVNHENFSREISPAFRTAWEMLMILAFVMIWNHYKDKKTVAGIPVWIVQVSGMLVLVILALLYRGNSDAPAWMRPHWWGILGIIGWAYIVCAFITMLAGKRLWIPAACWLFFHAMNVLEFIPMHLPKFPLVVSASNHALVMGGVLSSLLYMKMNAGLRPRIFPLLLLLLAVFSFAYGFMVRPLWGISKIHATPSWTSICMGISMLSFLLIYLVTEILHQTEWARPIMPAGRSTLTCYLLPGLVYPVVLPLMHQLPENLFASLAGLIKSFLFALFIVFLTGLLERVNVRLKI